MLTYKNVTLDVDKHEYRVDEEKIYLRFKDFSVMKILMENKGKVCKTPDIMAEVWPNKRLKTTAALAIVISNLRKVFPYPINNVHKVGYYIEEE